MFLPMDLYGKSLGLVGSADGTACSLTAQTVDLLPDFADYIGPVQIRKTSHGRGLHASRNIAAGELLLCCKPLVFVPSSLFVPALQNACKVSPHSRRVVMELLHDGTEMKPAPACLSDLSWSNAHGPREESLPEMPDIPSEQKALNIMMTNSFGNAERSMLYPAIAMANHSCCPNATTVLLGHTMLLRASNDIKAGAEVVIPYVNVFQSVTNRRHLTLKTKGFQCECPRCNFECSLPAPLQERHVPVQDIEAHLASNSEHAHWLRASHISSYRKEGALTEDQCSLWRSHVLRAIEAVDPSSHEHVKASFLDFDSKRRLHRPDDETTQQALLYTTLAHKARFGELPPTMLNEFLRRTEQTCFQ
eukprot:TRINITY_DN83735_c0_g1_i1.p1 TRINITY_DN83735_c0_g1~~TRINITY_DN83735_c0_g1_i1.p1  ORF type:complete len:422 (-),score=70.65 TRINITY_DN83735_c0_g1_i1:29-1114(-)